MWIICLVEFLLFSFIYGIWAEKEEQKPKEKRKFKLQKGITYLITAGISLLLVEYFGGAVLFYTTASILVGIGSILSAINPNIRNIYSGFIFVGAIMLLTKPYFDNHVIFFSILYLIMIYGIILAIKEGIQNMRNGIDPDVIEEEKAARRRMGFKIAKFILRIWK